ncbi:hypothetical protein Aperf_G00000000226 [Anoplocephala perfoliata]
MANFGKFIDAASTAFNRASQYTSEIRGAAVKTAYPDDVIRDFDTADKLKKVCEKLQSGVTAWLNPNPADRMQDMVLERFDAKKQPKLTSAELLGKLEQDLSNELTQTSDGEQLGIMLSQHSQAQIEMGVAERLLIDEIQKGFLASAKYYLETVWTSINTQRRNLELARLDYDSAKQKKDACTSEDKIRPLIAAFETNQTKYNDAIAAAREVNAQLKTIQDHLCESFKAMAAAQMRYYNTCQEQLKKLTGKWEGPGHYT